MRTSRRRFLELLLTTTALVSTSRLSVAIAGEEPDIAWYREPGLRYLTSAEADFLGAAVDRLIPPDELGPGARDAGVVTFIYHQLAGPYGRAERWYMQGPWADGTDEQGYQTALTPAQLYRAAIAAIDGYATRSFGGSFVQLTPENQDKVLESLEKGEADLGGVSSKTFFETLLQNAQQGFFGDPLYGGNRDFAGWKLIGYPGPRYNYGPFIEQHGKRFELPFVSIAGRSLTGQGWGG